MRIDPASLGPEHLGLTVTDFGLPDGHRPSSGRKIVRLIHETGLRKGTFVGYSTDDEWLQHWGAFYYTASDSAPATDQSVDSRPIPAPDALTAGTLRPENLGQLLRPDDDTTLPVNGTWWLERVEYDATWSGAPVETAVLIYKRDRPDAQWRDDWRVSVPLTMRMIPAKDTE